MKEIATLIFLVGIAGLFWLDCEPKARTSLALWIPVGWLLLAGSRQVSLWLGMQPENMAERYLEGSPLDRAIYAALLLTGIAVLCTRTSAVARVVRANWPILLFVTFCALSTTWSDYPGVAFKRWIKALGDYVMILILLTDRDRNHAIKQVLARVGFLLLPLSVLVVKYYPEIGRTYSLWEGRQFYTGVAVDKNMLGMACLVFGLAAVWRVLHELQGRRRLKLLATHGTIVVMAVWLVVKCDSMTSLACFVLASGLMTAMIWWKVMGRRKAIHVAVAAILAVCVSALFFDMDPGILKNLGRDSTLTGRTYIWKQVLKVDVNPMVGAGFESFWLGKRLDHLWSIRGMTGINEAHNGFLEVYLNLGLIGVGILMLFAAIGYRNIIDGLAVDVTMNRLRLGYFVAAMGYSFTEASFRNLGLVWIVFLFASMKVRIFSDQQRLAGNRENAVRFETQPPFPQSIDRQVMYR